MKPNEKDVQAEAVSQPGDTHPDRVFGDAVYQWTGKMTFKRRKTRPGVILIETSRGMRKQEFEEDDGIEELPYPGACLTCGEETYAWASGPHSDHSLGNALAVFAPASKNEPPLVYCQKHDPGRDHRAKSGKLRPDEAEGAVVRVVR